MALLLTFISGLFFLVGMIIYRFTKHKNELTIAAMSTAFIVIIGLIIFDLIPELLEFKKWYLFIFVIIGLIILLLLDKLVPHHHHDHHENDEATLDHQHHLQHIGFITVLALILHNMVECMALYTITTNDLNSGILMLVGIGLHNLPFGFQIANYGSNFSHKLAIFFLIISGFIGGLIIHFFGSISEFVTGIILSITLGMIIYILFFELLREVWSNIRQKATYCGIIIGILLLLLINII